LAPNLNWHDVPVRDRFESRGWNLPVFVDNNVRAMALPNPYSAQVRMCTCWHLYTPRIGVGGGFVIDGSLFFFFFFFFFFFGGCRGRGDRAYADRAGQRPGLSLGQTGCLETLVSDDSGSAAHPPRRHPNSILAECFAGHDSPTYRADFCSRSHSDEAARCHARHARAYMGSAGELVNSSALS